MMFAARLCIALLVACEAAAASDVTAIVVDANGAELADAVIYLNARMAHADVAPKSAEIDQLNKMFRPEVSVIRTGTPVSFPNSDNIRHHVYSFSPAKVFDLKLYSGRPSTPVIFDKAGVVTLGCNIHDQMIAWILVVDTPWFAKSGADGRATIANAPDGDYELHAWHPGVESEPKPQSIRIGAAVTVTRTIRLQARSIAQLRREASANGAH